MTRYRIFRTRNPVQQQQQHKHGQDGADEVPGLQLVRSGEDSCSSTTDSSSFLGELIPAANEDYYPQARVFQSSKWTTLDVHTCKSILCDSCRRPQAPCFLTVPVVPASTISCLPTVGGKITTTRQRPWLTRCCRLLLPSIRRGLQFASRIVVKSKPTLRTMKPCSCMVVVVSRLTRLEKAVWLRQATT
jgi:hypothetical protein